MRLTAIELENFKGVGDRRRIDLRPITLLFGPNSAGKSTVLQALHYAREVLERQNVDPDVTIAGGLLNLGNFAAIVHQHDLRRAVGIKLEVDLTYEQGTEELSLNSRGSNNDSDFGELPIRYLAGEASHVASELQAPNAGAYVVTDYAIVQNVAIDLEVKWSVQRNAPYVSRMTIELDNRAIASIKSPAEEGRAQLTDFNFSHPLLRTSEMFEEDVFVSEVDKSQHDPAELEHLALLVSPLEDQIRLLSREAARDDRGLIIPSSELRVALNTVFGALPRLDRDLVFELRDPDVKKAELEAKTSRVVALNRLLNELVLGPARIVRNCLQQMTYIGPLREIPSRSYRPQASPDEGRWAHGLAAWDFLYSNKSGELIKSVNEWLADQARLNTGYRLDRVEYREIEMPGPFSLKFQQGLNEDDLVELEELYAELPTRQEVVLRDERTSVVVGPNDVGVGLSQLIPVIVGALALDEGLLCIEQPELHIHPAIQVGLGDLFATVIRSPEQSLPRDRTLLLETHSEHIMLRLLRRIRETHEEEVPPGTPKLTPEDVAVIYVETNADGVSFKPLRVSIDGDFIDQWPRGFFEERAKELF
jgi:predicted ATPase